MSCVGCGFVCKNEDCECFDTGFTLNGIWPLGKINVIIKNSDDDVFKKELRARKKYGHKYAKITYPDPHNTEIVGYSVEKFCKGCKRIQTFDVKDPEEDTPDICAQCKEEYINFHSACEDGIDCPYCGDKLSQNRWYVNEKEEEDDR